MISELFHNHFTTIVLLILFSILLWPRKRFKNTENIFFWITVISCFLLVVEDIAENWVSGYPSLRLLRIFISVLGYNFRCVAAVGMLFVIVKPEKRKFTLWIPCLIHLAVCCTAFFLGYRLWLRRELRVLSGPSGICLLYCSLLLSSADPVDLIFPFYRKEGRGKGHSPVLCDRLRHCFCRRRTVWRDAAERGHYDQQYLLLQCALHL